MNKSTKESYSECCKARVSDFGVCHKCKNTCIEIFPESTKELKYNSEEARKSREALVTLAVESTKECKRCGLTKETCEMQGGDDWVNNCMRVKGQEHDFGKPTKEGDMLAGLTPKPTKEWDWEKEFDNLVKENHDIWLESMSAEVKSFITDLLSKEIDIMSNAIEASKLGWVDEGRIEERERVIEIKNKLRKEYLEPKEHEANTYKVGYNTALEDLITKLKP